MRLMIPARMEVICLFALFLVAQGALILDGSKPERTFDGIGGLSGGGATSRFLPSYEDPYISQILDYLFLPNFGASLQILKVEIGGDCQTTEGTESSHMHDRDDLNYERGYEWWLMQEAKARNPDILLYALSWGVPGWIGGGNFFSEDNIDYHIKWLEGAKKVYGLDIDYFGIWNERGYESDWIIRLRSALDSSGFKDTKIVGHDAGFDIAEDMAKNATLKEAVSIVGVHYPGTTSPAVAQELGNPLWSSEDYSTFADSTGGGCWARILNQNYVNGYMTSTISWNLIAAYYTGLPFPKCGLMYADNPWSGHYDVQSPIWVSAHTTQFTKPGWKYLAHGSGTDHLPEGGSYVTLVPPTSNGDFTLVIETMTHDHSVCIRPGLPPYTVSPQTVTFQLQGGLATDKPLYVWYTHLEQSQNNTYFEHIKTITPTNGQFTLTLDLDSVWTVSTLTGQKKGSHPDPPKRLPFPSPYTDDFSHYKVGQEADFFMDQTGVWEIYKGNASLVMRQQVLIPPIAWCGESNRPISFIGENTASDSSLTIDALIEGTGSVGVGLRVQNGGCQDSYADGYFFSIDHNGMYNITAGTTIITHGTITPFSANKWYTFNIEAKNTSICATIAGTGFSYCFTNTGYRNGFVTIGSGWNHAQFDNIKLVTTGPACGRGDLVVTQSCGSSDYQAWSFASDGTIKLLNTNNCLEVNGTDPSSGSPSVRTLPCNPQLKSQVWKYDGVHITSAVDGHCLDITSNDQQECAAVEVYICNSGDNQVWTLTEGNLLVTKLSGLCLSGNA